MLQYIIHKRFFLLCLALVTVQLSSWGQTTPKAEEEFIYQLSGMLVGENSSEAISYGRIRVNHSRRGVLTNEDGFYSIPVSEQDTLYFSHVGYHPQKFVVKKYLDQYRTNESLYLYVVNYLREDTLTLPTVRIFPYDTPEELRTAVINMEADPNSAIAKAQRNLDPRVMDAIIQTLPVDGGERLMVGRQMYYDYYRTKNLAPSIGFDPIAATRLLQYVVKEARRKRDKDLNYWE